MKSGRRKGNRCAEGGGRWELWHLTMGEKRDRSTQGDRVLFSSVGLWEGFLGVRNTWSPYLVLTMGDMCHIMWRVMPAARF